MPSEHDLLRWVISLAIAIWLLLLFSTGPMPDLTAALRLV